MPEEDNIINLHNVDKISRLESLSLEEGRIYDPIFRLWWKKNARDTQDRIRIKYNKGSVGDYKSWKINQQKPPEAQNEILLQDTINPIDCRNYNIINN